MRLTLTAAAPAVSADLGDARALSGLAVPYGVAGATSAGLLTVDAGAVKLPEDLRRVKLFREHGRTTPVGYATAADDSPAGLTMTFRAAATPDGDTALLEAAEGVRDALSVELDAVDVDHGHITAAELVGVALTSIPAYADARLTAADDPDPDPERIHAMTAPAPAPVVDELAPPPPDVAASLIPAGISAAPRPPAVTAARAIEQIRQAVRGATDAAQVNAALSDIVPGNDTGQAFFHDQWLGELWTPVAPQRPYIASMSSATLTGLRVYGWKWTALPEVDDYAGNKAAIPSNPVSIGPAEADAYRLAGGWDVDRAYVDLGAPGFLEALFGAAVADYGRKSNAKAGAFLAANATVSTAIVTNLVDALAAVASFLGENGATPSWIAISSDLWSDYLSLTSAEAPWWLSVGAGSVSIKDPAGSVADLRFFVDPGLAAGTVLAGDKRAATHYEAAGSPLRVQALNIPNGGIDIGVFGYAADLLNDARGLVKQAVTGGVTGTRSSSSSKSDK